MEHELKYEEPNQKGEVYRHGARTKRRNEPSEKVHRRVDKRIDHVQDRPESLRRTPIGLERKDEGKDYMRE